MNRPVVAFTSRYGSTRRYATALASRFGTPATKLADLATASEADPLIVLSPLYATRIRGRRRIIRAIRSAPGRAALVVVGMSPTDDPGRATLADALVAASGRAVATFQLRGDFDPTRLGPLDRALMAVLRSRLRKTPDEPAARLILAREPIRFIDESTLDPVVAWANGLTGRET
ncbi:flavodoxin domain-containing protein [Rhodococcus sp. IEGM 1408]|uniref:flavodoxin domain-containing protein n=1 Tax=Rhodococcus sp. IEGM 1408 TaxID=3082220 RepID=UPI002953A557|nr:flavodoxin domain-containing protein [Rhodococcus sp. IEGM 1408]MDV8002529.1 flavodoxin domain-containing protein [Rhodococcus sp. IEGM 1408]